MYRFGLSFRYLMRRWLTLLSVIGVLLGVGTLVVVLAVMGGFVKEVRQAIRGGLSDVIVDSDITGFPHYDQFVDMIKRDPNVVDAAPQVQLFGLVQIDADSPAAWRAGVQGARVTKPCVIYGIRPEAMARVCDFHRFLTRQGQTPAAPPTLDVPPEVAERLQVLNKRVRPGIVPGIELVTYEPPRTTPRKVGEPDDSVLLSDTGSPLTLITFPVSPFGGFDSVLGTPKVNMAGFTVVDHYKSRVYEFDNKYVFIPFEAAQNLGGLGEYITETGKPYPPRAHQVLIKLKDPEQAAPTIERIKAMWVDLRREHPELALSVFSVLTWQQRQATILGAVEMERTLMVIVVGLIVLLASFLIGAVLSMIVKEKTRDIGILKALGASNVGVAQIFLLYGAGVGALGASLGVVAGLLFVRYIDPIERWVSNVLGVTVFDRKVYYFDQIPRDVVWSQVAIVALSAAALAVLCSTVAAWKAARLQPVEALRYE